jgi:hypothetical protein
MLYIVIWYYLWTPFDPKICWIRIIDYWRLLKKRLQTRIAIQARFCPFAPVRIMLRVLCLTHKFGKPELEFHAFNSDHFQNQFGRISKTSWKPIQARIRGKWARIPEGQVWGVEIVSPLSQMPQAKLKAFLHLVFIILWFLGAISLSCEYPQRNNLLGREFSPQARIWQSKKQLRTCSSNSRLRIS